VKHCFCLISVIFLISCAGARVKYDYDKDTHFTKYSTYQYYPDMETGLGQLDERRLLRILDSTLRSKGYMLSERPDFFINIISEEFQGRPRNNIGIGVGGTNRNIGGGISVGLPVGGPQLKRRIQFDLVDSQHDNLFWQGASETSFKENATPLAREELLRKVVVKVFSKYPPE